MAKHLLSLRDFSKAEINACITRAIEIKQQSKHGIFSTSMHNKTMTMIFEKHSTRTRISFETAMLKLGGNAIFLSKSDSQLGRNEPIADTAKVLSSMTDILMMRTTSHDKIEELAKHSSVPVINGLTDNYHPCQLLADLMTIVENGNSLANLKVTWLGDCFNMFNTWVEAASICGFELHYSCPKQYLPKNEFVEFAKSNIFFYANPRDAVKGVNVVTTDVWTSMGQEESNTQRLCDFKDYQVNSELMQLASSDAIFLHCMPVHRNQEVTAEVIESNQSKMFSEAENRLYAQQALIEMLIPT